MPHFRFFLLSALLWAIGAPRAGALILIGSDESLNDVAPGSGAPWQYVAQIGGGKGSGVYLGNGFVLTANHVSPNTPVVLDGVTYATDPAFEEQVGTADLKLLRLIGNPGLAPLPLVSGTTQDLSTACTIIGWGLGKGAVVPNQGWMWGPDSTHAERWGTNTTLPALFFNGSTAELQASFDLSAGNNEAQLASADSGCGLFELIGGKWELAGIGVDVTTDQEALYDTDPNTPGNQPDESFFIEIKAFASDIQRLDAAPEPSAGILLVCGLGLLAGRRKRRKECYSPSAVSRASRARRSAVRRAARS